MSHPLDMFKPKRATDEGERRHQLAELREHLPFGEEEFCDERPDAGGRSRPCLLLAGHEGGCRNGHLLGYSIPGLSELVDPAALRAALARLDAIDLEAERRQDAERRAGHWEMTCPARFAAATVDTLKPREAKKVREWLAGEGNLLLVGPVGVGKTWAATAVVRELFFGELHLDYTMTSSAAMFAGLRPNGGSTLDDFIRPQLLLIDDLGVEKLSEWVYEQLYAIVDGRWRERRAIVATSNLNPTDLETALGRRITDRLLDGATVVTMLGDSRRQGAVA